jgi:hypothetical protein
MLQALKWQSSDLNVMFPPAAVVGQCLNRAAVHHRLDLMPEITVPHLAILLHALRDQQDSDRLSVRRGEMLPLASLFA